MKRMVSSASVEQACAEVSDFTDERMMTEFERFFQEQPAICDFVVEATSSSRPKVREFSLFLSFMVFKAANIDGFPASNPVSEDAIDASCRECERWVEQIHAASESGAGVPGAVPREDEPHLVEYVISELNEPLEDGHLEDDERGEVFFVLKTVIGSLAGRKHEIED
ncbi:MAG TPA: hypothetical protein VFY29_02440 [Terriglobia bacterium]|nr:hypothetical protein [Terriglobia bacterium]